MTYLLITTFTIIVKVVANNNPMGFNSLPKYDITNIKHIIQSCLSVVSLLCLYVLLMGTNYMYVWASWFLITEYHVVQTDCFDSYLSLFIECSIYFQTCNNIIMPVPSNHDTRHSMCIFPPKKFTSVVLYNVLCQGNCIIQLCTQGVIYIVIITVRG